LNHANMAQLSEDGASRGKEQWTLYFMKENR
jgi:hypothetical protein